MFRFQDEWDDGRRGWRLFAREDGALIAHAHARPEFMPRRAIVFAVMAAVLLSVGLAVALAADSLFEQGRKTSSRGTWRRSQFTLRSYSVVKGDLSGPRTVSRGPDTYDEVLARYGEHQESEKRYGGTYLQSTRMRRNLGHLEAVATAGGAATVLLALALLLATVALGYGVLARTAGAIRRTAALVTIGGVVALGATVYFEAKLSLAAEPDGLLNHLGGALVASGTLWTSRSAWTGAIVLGVLAAVSARIRSGDQVGDVGSAPDPVE